MNRPQEIAAATLMLIAALPASATNITLTFDAASQVGAVPACTGADGGLTDRLCNNNSFIGVDYGSTPQLAVSYNAGGSDVSLRAVDSSFYQGGAFNFGDTAVFSDIVFTPTPGNEVSLLSWAYDNGTATAVSYFFEVRDSSNNLIASHTAATQGSFVANTAYFSGPLTFRFRSGPGTAVIDNVAVDVRGSVVPAPAAVWLLGSAVAAIGVVRRRI